MPIRFRCAYCNQLLGIARRKAGTVVRCPTCAGQVVVPSVETNEPEGQPGEEKQLIFERSDFDELLNTGGAVQSSGEKKPTFLTSSEEPIAVTSPVAPAGGSWGAKGNPQPVNVERALSSPVSSRSESSGTDRPGLFLSRTSATVFLIVAIVVVALAFGGGVLVGQFLSQPPASSAPGP